MKFSERIDLQYKEILGAAGGHQERSFRERAWAEYARQGLPDRKTETWKYSNLTSLTKAEWPLSIPSDIPQAALSLRDRWTHDFDVVLVVNGQIRSPLPLGMSAMKFAYDQLEFEDGWIGLSAAIARPGYDLRVKAKLNKPILILHAHAGERAWSSTIHRILIDSNSSAEIAEVYLGSANYMRSEITVAHVKDAASLTWIRIQHEDMVSSHFSDVQCHLAEGARLNMIQINAGAAWSRSTFRADIHGQGADAHIGGLTFARDSQHCDQRVEVRHRAANTSSAQLFKGVLKDRARGVLNGKIYIARDAQKVVSSQLNHNLLLSSTAEADTKPELEIYADDVKANHGASIGRLDEDKVFYLMSRGITRHAAQQMLARAFVTDVLMKIPSPTLLRFAQTSVEKILPEFSVEMEAKL